MPAHAQEPPLVLAFYYAWYDQNTWTSGTTTDSPLEPYSSADPAVIQRHVALAQSAGIDALIVSWYGPQEANNQTETNLRLVLDAAAAQGTRAAVAFETNGPFFSDRGSVTEALRHLLTVHAQHPAYLRYEGRPVVFFWRQQRFGVDTWAAIRSEVDPDRTSLWIAEGVDIAFQSVFDGHYLYSVAWSPDVNRTLSDWGGRVQRYAGQNDTRRLWVATVMPGYDDTRSGRASAFRVGRRDGEYYRSTWAAAIASRPDWVVITSFNEWVEGTMIEPSVSYGDLYLNLTRELAAQYKASPLPPAPPLEPPATPVAVAETPTLSPVPTASPMPGTAPADGAPQLRALGTVRIRSGPGTQFAILGLLSEGQTARAIGRNADDSWWQIEFPATGGAGWVTAEFVEVIGNATGLPVVGEAALTVTASPASTPTRTATATLTASLTPTVTVTSTPTRTATATAAASLTPTVTVTSTPTQTATATARASLTPTAARTATATRSLTATATASPTMRPSATPTAAPTATPAASATLPQATAAVSATVGVTPTAGAVRPETATRLPTASPTRRATGTITLTPRVTVTATAPVTPAPAMTATAVPDPAASATAAPARRVTPTRAPAATLSPTPEVTTPPAATASATPAASATPSVTALPTPLPTATRPPTVTPSPTATASPTRRATPSSTPEPTATPAVGASPTPRATPTRPPTATPSPPPPAATPGPTPTVPPFITPLVVAAATPTREVVPDTPTIAPTLTATTAPSPTPTPGPTETPTAVMSPTPTSVLRLEPGGNGTASVGGLSILLWLGIAALLCALGLALALKGRMR